MPPLPFVVSARIVASYKKIRLTIGKPTEGDNMSDIAIVAVSALCGWAFGLALFWYWYR
jgi:fatty acid desaturase